MATTFATTTPSYIHFGEDIRFKCSVIFIIYWWVLLRPELRRQETIHSPSKPSKRGNQSCSYYYKIVILWKCICASGYMLCLIFIQWQHLMPLYQLFTRFLLNHVQNVLPNILLMRKPTKTVIYNNSFHERITCFLWLDISKHFWRGGLRVEGVEINLTEMFIWESSAPK